ncbi:TPA: hypothetical protein ACPGNJ_001685 [Haemophilus influenzae]|uniref:hypothetical protein n=1 Tax=Haemophilus influenzae TaxID=727 RepID=UPI003F79AAAF
MKEFNLDAALNGEQVKLRNGLKAIVYHRIPDEFSYPGGSTEIYPLIGIIFNKDGTIKGASESWKDYGAYCSRQGGLDIVGMWEDPKISIEDLPKPFYPNDGDAYYYIFCGKIYYVNCYSESNPIYENAAKNGQYFRAKEDAQKWLDFMKSMME